MNNTLKQTVKQTVKHSLVTLAAIAASLASSAGCSSDHRKDEAFQDPFFPPQGNVPATTTMFQKQYALGAAEDGMLFAIHFDGDKLNSLGKQKLNGIVAGTPAETKISLFLNLPKDAANNAARQANVEETLKTAGLTTEQYALAIGPNPGAMRPADAGVRALDLQRSTQGNATASSESTNLPVSSSK